MKIDHLGEQSIWQVGQCYTYAIHMQQACSDRDRSLQCDPGWWVGGLVGDSVG